MWKRCLNIHLLLDEVNKFRKTTKLPFNTSATAFVQNCQILYPIFIDSVTHDQIPEYASNKKDSFYSFEIKEEYYYKNSVQKTYNKTAIVDKNEKGSKIVKCF